MAHSTARRGETTVTLGPDPGKGGRNQEWTLSALCALGEEGMRGAVVLSGGTDGEDGPTDAAGALADEGTLLHARAAGLDALLYLKRHDAYTFFQATGDLLLQQDHSIFLLTVKKILTLRMSIHAIQFIRMD